MFQVSCFRSLALGCEVLDIINGIYRITARPITRRHEDTERKIAADHKSPSCRRLPAISDALIHGFAIISFTTFITTSDVFIPTFIPTSCRYKFLTASAFYEPYSCPIRKYLFFNSSSYPNSNTLKTLPAVMVFYQH